MAAVFPVKPKPFCLSPEWSCLTHCFAFGALWLVYLNRLVPRQVLIAGTTINRVSELEQKSGMTEWNCDLIAGGGASLSCPVASFQDGECKRLTEPAEECDGDYLPAPQPPPLPLSLPWSHTERWTDAGGKTALCVDSVSAVGPLVLGIVSRLCLNKAPSESLRWWGARCLSGRASALVPLLMWWWASLLLDVSAMLLIRVMTEGVISLIADSNCTLRGPDPILSLQLLICQLMMINDDSFLFQISSLTHYGKLAIS